MNIQLKNILVIWPGHSFPDSDYPIRPALAIFRRNLISVLMLVA